MIPEVWNYEDIDVYFTEKADGGGRRFGVEYFDVIPSRYPGRKFRHAMEWCAGPGFIGFGLLALGLCEELTVFEFFEPSVELLRKTKENNPNYADRINIIHSDNIASIPENIKFDLVVSNPPHFVDPDSWEQMLKDNLGDDVEYYMEPHYIRNGVDLNWDTHREFYKNIGKNLSDDGVILLQENSIGSNAETFSDMIASSGLKLKDSFTADKSYLYYIESMKI